MKAKDNRNQTEVGGLNARNSSSSKSVGFGIMGYAMD